MFSTVMQSQMKLVNFFILRKFQLYYMDQVDYFMLQQEVVISPKQYTPAALSLGSSLPHAGRSGLEQFRIFDSVPKQFHCTFRIPPVPFPNTTPFISGTAVV